MKKVYKPTSLPIWLVEPGEKRGTLNITCPRKECKGKAIVNKRKWLEDKKDFVGRSCTYCFKAAGIPIARRAS